MLQVREVIMQAFGSTAVRSAMPVFSGVAEELVEVLLMSAGQETGAKNLADLLMIAGRQPPVAKHDCVTQTPPRAQRWSR